MKFVKVQLKQIWVDSCEQQFIKYYKAYYKKMTSINAWTVLVRSPHQLSGEEHEGNQTFFQMIQNLLAPYYKLKSFTTFLMMISLIIYIVLVIPYPPFIRIPTFALSQLVLQPQHLKQFQFYRLFTAPFVYQDITALVIGILLLWCFGSFTESTIGWKMFAILTNLSGLIGYSDSFTFPIFLIGSNFSIMIMKWADPNSSVLYRKFMLVIYVILVCIFVLMFINYSKYQKYNFYISALFGFLLTASLGKANEEPNLSAFRKMFSTFSLFALFFISTLLFLDLILYGNTFV